MRYLGTLGDKILYIKNYTKNEKYAPVYGDEKKIKEKILNLLLPLLTILWINFDTCESLLAFFRHVVWHKIDKSPIEDTEITT